MAIDPIINTKQLASPSNAQVTQAHNSQVKKPAPTKTSKSRKLDSSATTGVTAGELFDIEPSDVPSMPEESTAFVQEQAAKASQVLNFLPEGETEQDSATHSEFPDREELSHESPKPRVDQRVSNADLKQAKSTPTGNKQVDSSFGNVFKAYLKPVKELAGDIPLFTSHNQIPSPRSFKAPYESTDSQAYKDKINIAYDLIERQNGPFLDTEIMDSFDLLVKDPKKNEKFSHLRNQGSLGMSAGHDAINLYNHQYLRAKTPEARQIAIRSMRRELESGENPSAETALHDLLFLDAVHELRTAETPEQRREALERLARQEAGNKKHELDEFPDLKLDPADLSQARAEVIRDVGRVEQRATEQVNLVRQSQDPQERARAQEQLEKLAEERYERFGTLDYHQGVQRFKADTEAQSLQSAVRAQSPEQVRERLESLVALQSSDNQRAKDIVSTLGGDEQVKSLLDQLSSEDPVRRNTALADLNQNFSKLDKDLKATRFMSPSDILNSSDQDVVAEARRRAEKFEDTNFKKTEAALDSFIDADPSTPEGQSLREKALEAMQDGHDERVEMLNSGSFRQTLEWARGTNLADRIAHTDDPKVAAEALQGLQDLSEANNHVASATLTQWRDKHQPDSNEQDVLQNTLRELTSESDPLAQATALEQLQDRMPDGSSQIQDYRVRRTLRGLDSDASAEKFLAASKLLEKEKEAGNPNAEEWIGWAQAHGYAAQVAEAKTPETSEQAISGLQNLANEKDPHAKRLLASLVMQGTDEKALLNWYGEGHGEIGTKPVFTPSLESLSTEHREQVKSSAVTALVDVTSRSETLEDGDATAIAMGLAHAQANGDKELKTSIHQLYGTLLDDDKRVEPAMEGLVSAVSYDTRGSEALAEVYLTKAEHPSVKTHVYQFSKKANQGDVASMRVLAGLVSGLSGDKKVVAEAERGLTSSADVPELREKAMEAMVYTDQKYGDQGKLMATLGTVANRGATVSGEVRETLHGGLERSASSLALAQKEYQAVKDLPRDSEKNNKERRTAQKKLNRVLEIHDSALTGVFAISDKWTSADVGAVTDHVTPSTAKYLSRAMDSLSSEHQKEVIEGLRLNLRQGTGTKASASLQSLGALGGELSREDVETIKAFGQDTQASKSDRAAAGRALLNTLARTSDTDLKEQLAHDLLETKWGGLETSKTSEEDWEALVTYAQGRPFDLELNERVTNQIYDAGLPKPVAGIFKEWGVPGDNQALMKKAEQATSHYGAKTIRKVANRVAMINALPPQLREELTGSASTVDPRQVVGQMANGALGEEGASNGFLLETEPDLQKRMDTLRKEANLESHQLDKERIALLDERSRAVRKLGKQTKKGIDFLDRVGYLFGSDKIDNYAREQGQRVEAISTLDTRISSLEMAQMVGEGERLGPRAEAGLLDLASETGEHVELMNSGSTREADKKALDMYAEHGGPALSLYAPAVWNELTRTGETPLERGAWQRANQTLDPKTGKAMAIRDSLPIYQSENGKLTAEGYQAALNDLKAAAESPNSLDRDALRENALRAMSTDPAVSSVGQSAAVFSDQLPVLQEMFKSGNAGTKYQDFVQDARTRAGKIQSAIASAEEQRPIAVKRLESMNAVLETLPKNSKERRALEAQAKGLENAITLLTPGTHANNTIQHMTKAIRSDDFDANTAANWLRKEGPALGATIVLSVGAAVLTGGGSIPATIAQAAFRAGVTTLTGVVTNEVTKEVLHQIRANTGSRLGTGRSRVGAYASGDKILDPNSLGGERGRKFWKDVGAPYVVELARTFAMTMGTMVIGNLTGHVSSKSTSFLASKISQGKISGEALKRLSSTFKVLNEKATRLSRFIAGDPKKVGVLRRFGGKILDEAFSESFDQGLEALSGAVLSRALEDRLEKGGLILTLAPTVLLAVSKGIKIGKISPSGNVPVDVGDTDKALKLFHLEGHEIEALNQNRHRVITPDGTDFVLESRRLTSAERIDIDSQVEGTTRSSDGTERASESPSSSSLDSEEPLSHRRAKTTDVPKAQLEIEQNRESANSPKKKLPVAPETSSTPSESAVELPEIIPADTSSKSYFDPDNLTRSISERISDRTEQVAEASRARKEKLAAIDSELENMTDETGRQALMEERKKAQELSMPEVSCSMTIATQIAMDADRMLLAARKDGKISQNEYTFMKAQVGGRHPDAGKSPLTWQMYRDLEKKGVIPPSLRSDLRERFQPYEVRVHEGFDNVREVLGAKDQEANFDGMTGEQKIPNRAVKVRAPHMLGASNRIFYGDVPKLKTSVGEVQIYNAGPSDILAAQTALARMEKMAPNLLNHVKEIHFSRTLNRDIRTYSFDEVETKRVGNETKGYMMSAPDMEPQSMIIDKRSGLTVREAKKSLVNQELRTNLQQLKNQGVNPTPEQIRELRKTIEIDVAQRLQDREYKVPDYLLEINEKAGTIIHENGHLLDFGSSSNPLSEKEWSSWTQKGDKFSSSPLESTDYVSDYAMTNAQEDFAETARFLVNFSSLENKPPLGTLSESLVKKFRKTAEVLGTPQTVVDNIIEHYGRYGQLALTSE